MSPHSPERLSRTPSPPQEEGPVIPTYLTTPLETIETTKPLFTNVKNDTSRPEESTQTLVHSHQRYLIANRTRDIFPTATVHVPSTGFTSLIAPNDQEAQVEYMNACDVVMQIEKTFAERRRYDICSAGDSRRGQLSVVMSELGNVWHVENFGLFSDIPLGTVLGKIHVIESMSSFFTFVPSKDVLPNAPRLEMQPAHNVGFGGFDLCVGGGACVGRVNLYRYYFYLELLESTREEALFWLCMIVAAELERRPPLLQFYTNQ